MGKNIEKIGTPRSVIGIWIFDKEGRLFLAKHEKWENKFNIPGGGVESGETLKEAAIRETKEETNMDIEKIEYLDFLEMPNLGEKYSGLSNHLISFHYKAICGGKCDIELKDGLLECEWLKPEEWLKRDDLAEHLPDLIKKYFFNEKIDFEHKYKLALADYQNLLKRTAAEKAEFAKYANENLIHEIIPVFDNLKTSMEHAGDADKNSWLEGIKFIIKQFRDTLNNVGVEEIKTIGEKFDHNIMEAMSSEETEDKKLDHTVAKELKAGYKLNGKVIIPARVVVYKIIEN